MATAPLEKTIVAAILRALRARGVWAVKIHGGPYQAAGIPDIIAVAPETGRFLGIEVKRPGGRLTELQRTTLKRIRDAGAVTGVAYSVEDALVLLVQANRREADDGDRGYDLFQGLPSDREADHRQVRRDRACALDGGARDRILFG